MTRIGAVLMVYMSISLNLTFYHTLVSWNGLMPTPVLIHVLILILTPLPPAPLCCAVMRCQVFALALLNDVAFFLDYPRLSSVLGPGDGGLRWDLNISGATDFMCCAVLCCAVLCVMCVICASCVIMSFAVL